MLDMLLKDANGKQIVLNQNPLTKEITITVIDKKTQKQKIYKDKRLVARLFEQCLQEGKDMWKYMLWYDGGFLRDSADLGYTFESEEEAEDEAEIAMEDYMDKWESDDCDDIDKDLFEVRITEV